jgi:endonuclease/exonuclease/phosphatase family metal-dependent hydrolase
MTQKLLKIVLVLCVLTPASWAQDAARPGAQQIDVATINLYVGADFSPVLSLDPSDPNYGSKLLAGVATIYAQINQSDFHRRADALAREIVSRGPDLVALQEVSWIRRQSPGDSIIGGNTPATEPYLDYLDILMKALEKYGAHYAVVAQVEDTDVEVPLLTDSFPFDDLRLTDRDVILARTDLPPGQFQTVNPLVGNFQARLPLPIGVSVLRGWCSIDVRVRDQQFRLINTHLEDRLPALAPNIQLAQAAELLAGPAKTSLPVILAGDFNSDANGNYSSETYSLLTTSGAFHDIWRAPTAGLTWGHDALLSEPRVPFALRLDLILFRGEGLKATRAVVVDPVIGATAPRWFSDHAALFGTLMSK